MVAASKKNTPFLSSFSIILSIQTACAADSRSVPFVLYAKSDQSGESAGGMSVASTTFALGLLTKEELKKTIVAQGRFTQ